MKTWVDQFVEWGAGRSHRPWSTETVRAYQRVLRDLERETGMPVEDLTADDLRTYQARRRAENASSWNRRVSSIDGFYDYLAAQGRYGRLTPQGERRNNPSGTLTKRRVEPKTRRPVDVRTAIDGIEDEPYRSIALFLYHSGLRLGQACSIDEPDVGGQVHVDRRGGGKEWVPLSREALDFLVKLGGRMPVGKRMIERRLPVRPRDIETAARRDHQLRTTHGDALGPIWALLIGRPALADVARAYRDAVEAMDGPSPRAKSAITAAARALQEMLKAMGATGNSLGPLFHSARSKGMFGSYDSKLADALESMVDWVNADRSGRGDAHVQTDPGPEDGWMAVRIVAAVLHRLEALIPPDGRGPSLAADEPTTTLE